MEVLRIINLFDLLIQVMEPLVCFPSGVVEEWINFFILFIEQEFYFILHDPDRSLKAQSLVRNYDLEGVDLIIKRFLLPKCLVDCRNIHVVSLSVVVH